MSKRAKFLANLKLAAESASRDDVPVPQKTNQPHPLSAKTVAAVPVPQKTNQPHPLSAKTVAAAVGQVSETRQESTRTKEWVLNTNAYNGKFIHDPSKTPGGKSRIAQSPMKCTSKSENHQGTQPCALASEPSSTSKKNPHAFKASPVPELNQGNVEDAISTHSGFSVVKSPLGNPSEGNKNVTSKVFVEPEVGETPKQGLLSVSGARRRLFKSDATSTNVKEIAEASTSHKRPEEQERTTQNNDVNCAGEPPSPSVLIGAVQDEERVSSKHLESNHESVVLENATEPRDIAYSTSECGTAALPGAELCEDVHGLLADLPEGVIVDIPFMDDTLEPPAANLGENELSNDEIEILPEQGSGSSIQKRRFTPPEKLTRKRLQTPKRWIRNVAREKLARGEEHLSVKGKLRRARTMREGCDADTCSFSCQTNITTIQRKSIFDQFWLIPNQKEKWDFVARHIEIKNLPENQIKKCAIKYFLRVDGTKIKVCKTMFLDTLDVCDSLVKTTVSKLKMGGYISPDKRKGHAKAPSPVLAGIKDRIREHIKLIPRMPSHYSRKDSNIEYITEDYNDCGDLHEEFTLWMAENYPQEKFGNLRQYRDVFNYEFNIGFFCSKKDTCDECTTWDNTAEEERPAIAEKHKMHRNNHDLVTAMKNADTLLSRKRESKSCLTVAHFDYEKILICPKGDVSIFYYKRKLSVSNFTIVDVGQYEDNCYVYDETVANKGSNEVASFLLHFIERKVEKGITEIRLYCDNCGGQNKNRNVATLLLYAASKFNIRIVLKYLVKGHTYNKADTVHSLIEKKTKKLKLYTPSQWYEKIKASKRSKSHPMNVIQVDQEMIFNWHDLQCKLNLDKDTSGAKIPWQAVVQLETSGSSPHELKYRTSFEEELKPVSTKLIGRPVNFKTYVLQRAYTGRLPLSKLKYADLIFYCDKKLIPPEFHDFYKNLPSNDAAADPREEEEQDDPREGRARKRRKPMPKKTEPKRKRQAGKKVVAEEEDSANEEEDLSE